MSLGNIVTENRNRKWSSKNAVKLKQASTS